MLKIRSVILACITLSILLLPLAHLKAIFFGIPLYSVETPLLVALLAYLYGWKSGEISSLRKINPAPSPQSIQPRGGYIVSIHPRGKTTGHSGRCWINFHDPRIVGILLFFLGAIISFVANPFSLTGLGMIKTWFLFPLLMAWLIFQLQPSEREKSVFLTVWFLITLAVASVSLAYVFLGSLTYDGRLAAWFLSPNYLAIFIAPGILIGLSGLERTWKEKELWTKLLFVASLFVLFGVLFLTRSYGVWLGTFSAATLMIFLSTALVKKDLWRMLSIMVIAGSLFLSFEYDASKWQSLVFSEGRSSLDSRVMIWQAATKMIVDEPIFGIGLSRFQDVYLEYQKYYSPYLEWAVPEPHNLILAVWLQTGLIGLFGFMLISIDFVRRALKNKNRESAVLLSLFVLYLVYGLFDTPFFKTDLAFAFWLLIALINPTLSTGRQANTELVH